MTTAATLRKLFTEDKLLTAPGVSDGLTTILAKQAGFNVIYASGGAISRSTGKPDIGLLTLTEVRDRLSEIVDAASDTPVVADADTGFGNEINVERMIHVYEQIGIAALHMEDQVFPKRCGHLVGKKLIDAKEMCLKIRVACKSRKNPDMVIIARTDAIAVEGFEHAIERMQAYLNAGADMAFVEAPESLEQIEAIAKAIAQPKLINMFYGGKTPLVPHDELAAMGYKLAIIPSDLQRAAIKAMQKTLVAIKADGDSHSVAGELATFKEREAIVNTDRYFNLAND